MHTQYGVEFIGWEFQNKLTQCRIEDKPTTSRNPKGNEVCERLHQTATNVLRTIRAQHHPRKKIKQQL